MSTPNVPQQPAAPQQPGYPAAQYTTQNPAPQQSYPQAPAPTQFTQQAQPAASKTTTLDKTNTFALVSIILAFISPIAAIVFGHLSLSQIKRTGDAGRGMALTGLIIGYVYAVSIVFFVIAYVGLIVALVGSASYMSQY